MRAMLVCLVLVGAADLLLTRIGSPLDVRAQAARPPTRERLPPPINPGDPIPHIKVPVDGDRIQVGRWTSATRSAVSDPLTQVVQAVGDSGAGTGFLLKDCRVLTNLHVLLGIKKGRRPNKLEDATLALGENLIGDVFTFKTQSIPWRDGARAVSHMVVLGHGANYTTDDETRSLYRRLGYSDEKIGELELLRRRWTRFPTLGPEDWAIGYDVGCISEHLSLGVIRLEYGVTARVAAANDAIFTAGYPSFTMDGVSETNTLSLLYVDSQCGLTRQAIAAGTLDVETTCSTWYGSSGSPLLSGPMFHPDNPERVYTDSGRPRVAAIGMFHSGGTPDPDVPSFYQRSWAMLFGDELIARMDPYLEGPVDVEALITSTAVVGRSPRVGSRMKVSVLPTYTEHAWRAGIRGEVTLEVEIRRDGTVRNVRVFKGLEAGLDQRAVAAARQWLYWPVLRDGAPTESTLRLVVVFQAPD